MHSLQTVRVADTLEVCLGLEDPSTRILDTLDNGVAPSGNGLLYPIGGGDLVHDASVVNQLGVCLFRNEIRVTPDGKVKRMNENILEAHA